MGMGEKTPIYDDSLGCFGFYDCSNICPASRHDSWHREGYLRGNGPGGENYDYKYGNERIANHHDGR